MAGNRFGSSITQPLVAEGYEAVCVDCDGMLGVAKPVEREPDVDMKPSIVVVLNDKKQALKLMWGPIWEGGAQFEHLLPLGDLDAAASFIRADLNPAVFVVHLHLALWRGTALADLVAVRVLAAADPEIMDARRVDLTIVTRLVVIALGAVDEMVHAVLR
jgi:hypothetical protein